MSDDERCDDASSYIYMDGWKHGAAPRNLAAAAMMDARDAMLMV